MNNKKIIIVGATGRVGNEMLSILDERNIPYKNIAIAASSKSEGKQINYMNHTLTVQNVCNVDFSKYDIALFSAGGEVSKQYAPIASDNGCIVIDNTSYFRMHNDIPLIVPEINISSLSRYNSKIISNPNCSTIQMVMPLKSLHDEFILEEVVVSTYQAVAGAGQKGIDELLEQTPKVLSNKDIEPNHFKKQIAFNVIPQIDTFSENGYTKEELKNWHKNHNIFAIPIVMLSIIAFLCCGFLYPNGWNWSWLCFFAIPVLCSLESAIRQKDPSHFAYPVFIAFIFCFLGVFYALWHPAWVGFVTIPLYYIGCDMAKGKNVVHYIYPVLVATAYVVVGFLFNLWHPAWIIFLTIPIYYWVVNLIKKK